MLTDVMLYVTDKGASGVEDVRVSGDLPKAMRSMHHVPAAIGRLIRYIGLSA